MGLSFAEEHAGTNAVSLALKWREPVWTLPEQNYCSLLSRFVLFAIPPTYALPLGITIATTAKQPPDWPLALLQHMSYSVTLVKRQGHPVSGPKRTLIDLPRRQKMVLLCIARGLTDQATAVELHISLDTVRYHKKKLYQRMNADNAVTMIIQALKGGLLSLDEI